MDLILETLFEPKSLEARILIGEPERISDALQHDDRYVECYGMISDREKGDHLQDRHNGDGEPDYYDFIVRCHELSEDDVFMEVDDVPVHLHEQVCELLCGFYQCDESYANN